jgi:hypothetical protein
MGDSWRYGSGAPVQILEFYHWKGMHCVGAVILPGLSLQFIDVEVKLHGQPVKT